MDVDTQTIFIKEPTVEFNQIGLGFLVLFHAKYEQLQNRHCNGLNTVKDVAQAQGVHYSSQVNFPSPRDVLRSFKRSMRFQGPACTVIAPNFLPLQDSFPEVDVHLSLSIFPKR